MPGHGKTKAKKESKTVKLNRLEGECRDIQRKLAEKEAIISTLEQQYQVDADGRAAYKKSTYEKLSKAYDKRERYNAELQQKQSEYAATEAEPESSSSDESKRSRNSKRSSGRSGSSKSADPATIGWDCGICGTSNINDPWGPVNWCACGHQFCDNDECCAVQWDPEA